MISGLYLGAKCHLQASRWFSASFGLSWKVYTLSVSGDRLIVGTAGRRVLVWDLRNMGYVQQRRESSLKYQTRCIRAFPNKQVTDLSSLCPGNLKIRGSYMIMIWSLPFKALLIFLSSDLEFVVNFWQPFVKRWYVNSILEKALMFREDK